MRQVVECWSFYLARAVRALGREKQRTAFALFCVAVGVAAIVGLQTLGAIIAGALTGNVQAINRGDVALVRAGDEFFSAAQMTAFERLVADGQATGVAYRYRTQGLRVATVEGEGAGQGLIVDSFLVDPGVYPFYSQVRALDPSDAPLADLLTGPNDVVIGKSLADRHDVAVGDHLQIGQPGARYVVRGVVPSASAVPGDNVAPLILGFVYLDYEAALENLDLERTASEVFFTTEDEAGATALVEQLAGIVPQAQARTAAELLEQNEDLSEVVNRLVLVVGLLALLIGGIGIVNTMQVTVARRMPEIAVLKALGLKGRQVTLLFLTEAAALGLAGSLVGLPLGLGVGRALIGFAAGYFAAPVAWRLDSLSLVKGLAVGVVVTAVSGFLPALAAAQTRPMQVLRPDAGGRPRIGRGRSLLVVLALTALIGLLAGQLVRSLVGGLVGAYATLLVLALLIGLLWTVVWVVEKLPSLGWLSLRLAKRDLGRNRARAASTLLALIVGLFSISLITILTASVIEAVGTLADDTVGADLIVLAPDDEVTRASALRTLEEHPGVVSQVEAAGFSSTLVAINGDPEAYERRIAAYEQDHPALTVAQRQSLDLYFSDILGRELTGNLPDLNFAPGMGRNFTPDDAGRPLALLPGDPHLAALDLQPGETLTFRLANDAEVTLEILGIGQESAVSIRLLNGAIIAPLGALSPLVTPDTRMFLADAHPRRQDEVVTTLTRDLPSGAIVIETAALVDLIAQLARQMTVLPRLVAALALFAAATMVANSAALAAMERRREIGVMKAVGVKANQILGQLLLESGILGLVGGLMGVGLALLVTVLLATMALAELPAGFTLRASLPLLALAVGVTLAATLAAAWPASRQPPMDVLRYE
ncbi:MAG: FtsX-like permease family protein [Anaerolineae bacterium]|jgi:ABC-type antimicrobial peptide transport system permease subunit